MCGCVSLEEAGVPECEGSHSEASVPKVQRLLRGMASSADTCLRISAASLSADFLSLLLSHSFSGCTFAFKEFSDLFSCCRLKR